MVKISISNLDFFYGKAQALYDISLDILENEIIAFIGPSGCGKSTFLRTLNRMNDTIPIARAEGKVREQKALASSSPPPWLKGREIRIIEKNRGLAYFLDDYHFHGSGEPSSGMSPTVPHCVPIKPPEFRTT